MRNLYPATCRHCGTPIAPRDGRATFCRRDLNGWEHDACGDEAVARVIASPEFLKALGLDAAPGAEEH